MKDRTRPPWTILEMWIRPDAMAAADIPSTIGVTSEAMPNTRVHVRCHAVPGSPVSPERERRPPHHDPAEPMPNGT